MRDHFNALLVTMLILQASAAVSLAETPVSATSSVHAVSLVEPATIQTKLMFEPADSQNSFLVSTHTRSATADVMNMPAEPIPTPPAFAMGMTVILGLMGYKTVRRLRTV